MSICAKVKPLIHVIFYKIYDKNEYEAIHITININILPQNKIVSSHIL